MPSLLLLFIIAQVDASGQVPIAIWPGNAPGESSDSRGELQPFRPGEKPPVSRVTGVRLPTMTFHGAKKPNGTAVVILPGGGFAKVVPDKEGTELAGILNQAGVSCFVLTYRTKLDAADPGWPRALQDAQRAMKWVRSHAEGYQLDAQRIGLLGFSAGGQVAARLLTDNGKLAYAPIDDVDETRHQPDFAMLIYPWNLYDTKEQKLVPEIAVNDRVPPTFIVHTHDDNSSSLGSVLFYAALKKAGVPAELHVYQNGGHGYGARIKAGSNIGSWPSRLLDWLSVSGLAKT